VEWWWLGVCVSVVVVVVVEYPCAGPSPQKLLVFCQIFCLHIGFFGFPVDLRPRIFFHNFLIATLTASFDVIFFGFSIFHSYPGCTSRVITDFFSRKMQHAQNFVLIQEKILALCGSFFVFRIFFSRNRLKTTVFGRIFTQVCLYTR